METRTDSESTGSAGPAGHSASGLHTKSPVAKATPKTGNDGPRTSMATITGDDDRLLLRIGYKPVGICIWKTLFEIDA